MVTVSEAESGQRLDNWLLRSLSGVPKTRVYKALRKGEVRVNKGRAKPETRLEPGDIVRIPPFRQAERSPQAAAYGQWADRIRAGIVHDDADLLVINKPSGLAVHGGSGVSVGLIESLRAMYPESRYLELVHRLDRDTSGLVLLARRASVLRELHALLRGDGVDKRYLTLVNGRWPAHLKSIDAPLERYTRASGERMVKVSADGKRAETHYRIERRWSAATLVEAKPVTGRTHQIRVHCKQGGHPILGDPKYADGSASQCSKALGLTRLFLHAARLSFRLGDSDYRFDARLPQELEAVCTRLDAQAASN